VKAPRFWSKPRPTLLARLLQPTGWAYGRATAQRMRAPGERVGAPTICVGNFTVGGAGKTPTALALARMLIGDGRRVAFLSRGYGGAARAEPLLVGADTHNATEVGDEPLLLAKLAQCWVGTDRVRSAKSAVEAGANTLILDDGLQNPGLIKDLSFAVVDGESGFGNGLCVPAGPLRAPVSAQLPFVEALIVLGGDDAAASRIAALARGKPVIRASLEPDALAAAPLIGREVVAFAGIARSEKFYATLRRVGAQIVATRDFADHHPYTQREVEALIEEARGRGALLATTEKDLVRLSARQARSVVALPVTLRFEEPASVRRILRQAVAG
jgi:tetraacyldisaccharide 4'-kinase